MEDRNTVGQRTIEGGVVPEERPTTRSGPLSTASGPDPVGVRAQRRCSATLKQMATPAPLQPAAAARVGLGVPGTHQSRPPALCVVLFDLIGCPTCCCCCCLPQPTNTCLVVGVARTGGVRSPGGATPADLGCQQPLQGPPAALGAQQMWAKSHLVGG